VMGEDEAGGLPSKDFAMAGVEVWGAWGNHGASWRAHAEYADTAVNGLLGDPVFGITYRHHLYTDGDTYRGRVIGHSLGGDGRMASVGLTYVTERGKPWDILIRRIEPVCVFVVFLCFLCFVFGFCLCLCVFVFGVFFV